MFSVENYKAKTK